MPSDGKAQAEQAPSQVRADEPTLARYAGGIGWGLVVVGGVAVIANRAAETPRIISTGWGWMAVVVGTVLALIHAAVETDQLLRRILGMVGAALVLAGLGWGGAMIAKNHSWSQGLIAVAPGLLFLALHLRIEEDESVRRIGLMSFGGVGLLLTLAGLIGTIIQPEMMPARYSVMLLAGPLLTLIFLGQVGVKDEWGYRGALALGAIGIAAILYAVFRSAIPVMVYDWRSRPEYEHLAAFAGGAILLAFGLYAIFNLGKPAGETPTDAEKTAASWGRIGVAAGGLLILFGALRYFAPSLLSGAAWAAEPPRGYLVPTGVTLIATGLVCGIIALGFASENRLVVMTRREFTVYFVSPVAYCVMIGFVLMAGVAYYLFLGRIILITLRTGQPLEEPIVHYYLIDWPPVVTVMAAVPLLTMRLFAEERRLGTLEVLLTAPVSDWMVVISKFIGAWLFYNLVWLPWWLFLLAMRLEMGEEFDFRPVLGYMVVMMACGAAFVAMGLFFSSLARDQIVAAALTLMGMMFLVGIGILDRITQPAADDWTTALKAVFRATSFIDMWVEAISGKLYVRDIIVQLSTAVFWLFATIKVLEVRRWS